MTHQLWSRPNLHGYKEPDFIIRRTDDSYMVVEIETPAKPIMTKQGNLSAYATQAIGQVLAYRSFLIDRSHALKHHLPRFTVPDCLVVIGLETVLDAKQAAALAVENEARHAVRIVGFDWLRARANAIVNNVIAHGTTAERIRIV
jgi:hypothetical protein